MRFAPAGNAAVRLWRVSAAENPAATRRAGETIIKAVQVLRQQPLVGRPADDLPPEYREG